MIVSSRYPFSTQFFCAGSHSRANPEWREKKHSKTTAPVCYSALCVSEIQSSVGVWSPSVQLTSDKLTLTVVSTGAPDSSEGDTGHIFSKRLPFPVLLMLPNYLDSNSKISVNRVRLKGSLINPKMVPVPFPQLSSIIQISLPCRCRAVLRNFDDRQCILFSVATYSCCFDEWFLKRVASAVNKMGNSHLTHATNLC